MMKKIIFFIMLVFAVQLLQAQNKIRLAKKETTANGKTQVEEYKYDSLGRIEKITQSSNGKTTTTITEFVFNGKGLLVSYKKVPSIKTFPERVSIAYDEKNRLSVFETTGGGMISKKTKTLNYSGDTIKITESQIKGQETIFIIDADSNIIRKQGFNNGKPTYTILYNKFDFFANPIVTLGGFIEVNPTSKHNCVEEEYSNRNPTKRKIEYEQILVSKYKPGGPKIPNQYRNGMPLKVTEISLEKKDNTEVEISTTTYQYIKL